MSQAKSYYELLGVSCTATAQEIRAAYVRLMKRHHPDAVTCDDGADMAPLLNRCYAVLRDPVKRSQHDAQLSASRVPGTQRLQHPARRRAKGTSGRMIVLFGFTAFALSLFAFKVGEQTTGEFAAPATGWVPGTPLLTAPTLLPLPERAVAQRMADLAQTLSNQDAENFSRECFASASRQLNAGSADSCVLFDTAFRYLQKTPVSTATFPAYFADQVVENRHLGAANAFGATAERRLAELRKMAFQALILLHTPPPQPAEVSPIGEMPTMLSDIQEGERRRLAEAGVP